MVKRKKNYLCRILIKILIAMATIQTFKQLTVWQEAMTLVEMIYRETGNYPKAENYGLTSQTRRAAVSVPANIAEGFGRQGRAEYLNFLSIAHGSLTELETHLLIAQRIGYLSNQTLEPLQKQLDSVGRLLNALRKALR
ncbi:MAG: four helix bundle protein [Bacteroidales bacterium]